MNRLIRISGTLFISATILLFIVRQRANRIAEIEQDGISGDDLRTYVDNESQMVVAGLVIAGLLITAALATLVTYIVKSRKPKPGSDG